LLLNGNRKSADPPTQISQHRGSHSSVFSVRHRNRKDVLLEAHSFPPCGCLRCFQPWFTLTLHAHHAFWGSLGAAWPTDLVFVFSSPDPIVASRSRFSGCLRFTSPSFRAPPHELQSWDGLRDNSLYFSLPPPNPLPETLFFSRLMLCPLSSFLHPLLTTRRLLDRSLRPVSNYANLCFF